MPVRCYPEHGFYSGTLQCRDSSTKSSGALLATLLMAEDERTSQRFGSPGAGCPDHGGAVSWARSDGAVTPIRRRRICSSSAAGTSSATSSRRVFPNDTLLADRHPPGGRTATAAICSMSCILHRCSGEVRGELRWSRRRRSTASRAICWSSPSCTSSCASRAKSGCSTRPRPAAG